MNITKIRIGIIPAAALALLGVLVGALLPLPQMGDAVNRSRAEQSADAKQLAEAQRTSEERIWKLYREREALQAQLDAAEETAAPEPGGPRAPGVYGDGVYIVGRDIEPGEYDGAVAAGGEAGYWARLKSTDGTVNSIITNGIVTGPFTLTVRQTDRAVELRGVTLVAQD